MLYATWNRLRKQKVSETPPLPLPRRDPPVQETRWIWFWDDQKKVMDGYWTDGPPLEPPGFRPNSYHSHYELPPDWLFPRGRRYSWWGGRARLAGPKRRDTSELAERPRAISRFRISSTALLGSTRAIASAT